MNKEFYVYILTNDTISTLYIGITNDLIRRIHEHKNDVVEGFTKRYRLHKLVYFESTSDVYEAITREKQLKGGSRQKKINLVNSINPNWIDLYDGLV